MSFCSLCRIGGIVSSLDHEHILTSSMYVNLRHEFVVHPPDTLRRNQRDLMRIDIFQLGGVSTNAGTGTQTKVELLGVDDKTRVPLLPVVDDVHVRSRNCGRLGVSGIVGVMVMI